MLTGTLSITLRVRAKVLLHVWSYDLYDTTLSTEQQRRHAMNLFIYFLIFIFIFRRIFITVFAKKLSASNT